MGERAGDSGTRSRPRLVPEDAEGVSMAAVVLVSVSEGGSCLSAGDDLSSDCVVGAGGFADGAFLLRVGRGGGGMSVALVDAGAGRDFEGSGLEVPTREDEDAVAAVARVALVRGSVLGGVSLRSWPTALTVLTAGIGLAGAGVPFFDAASERLGFAVGLLDALEGAGSDEGFKSMLSSDESDLSKTSERGRGLGSSFSVSVETFSLF